jgi:RNA polymerase subunit RPABC4/transcription elongation factor Spt4
MPRKICQNCSREFEDETAATASPAEVLGEIFLEAVEGNNPVTQDDRNLCPICREQLGIVNLLGFGS